MGFSAALEPLRLANDVRKQPLYEWYLTSADGSPVRASNGIEIPVNLPLPALPEVDMIIAVIGLDPVDYCTDSFVLKDFRRRARHGCMVGAINAGSFLLAEANLLTDRPCTVHWDYMNRFRARYPKIEVRPELFVIDRDIFTCSGGMASMDMMLHLIGRQWGIELALTVAEGFITPRIRTESDQQRMHLRTRFGINHQKMIDAIGVMERSLGSPLEVASVAKKVFLSTRQLERLFQSHFGVPPRRYYLRLRLERARDLLEHTAGRVAEVASQCGFDSAAHFTRAYKRIYQRTPKDDRLLWKQKRSLALNAEAMCR